tara:strand:- start:56 stop:916 length:861 start_codon:yes stop_codon:yes gene_type:complete
MSVESKTINLYLCSFASPDLDRSKRRFLSQAKKISIYKKIKVFGINDLSISKRKQIQNLIKINNRLYGYGCWKAEVIKKFLKGIPNNSIVQYSDVGCHLNENGLKRLKEYFQICSKKKILTFQYKVPKQKKKLFKNMKFQEYFEYQYTKMDLIKYLINKNRKKIINSEQIMSGIIFLKKSDFTFNLINEWEKVLKQDSLINDSESLSKNYRNFIEHRHDQSAFSLICKKRGVYSISSAECEWAEKKNKRIWQHLKYFPIHARRDKKYNIFKRFLNRQTKNLRRLIN